jgi:hypothetical protein
MSPFYRLDAGLFHPLAAAAAGAGGERQGSGAIGGLLAREIQRTPSLAPLWLARMTVEAPRAVPMAPVGARVRVLRDGKRLQLVQAELTIDGETYANALGLRVCVGDCPHDAPADHGVQGPEAAADAAPSVLGAASPLRARMIQGEGSGSFAYWAGCDADLVQGEATTTLVRAVMACDLAAAISRNARGESAYPGIDLSLYLARIPRGDWILAQNDAEHADAACGLVSSLLSDADGAFGYAHQMLVYAKDGPGELQP